MIGDPLIVSFLSPETTTLAPSQLLWPPGGRSSPPMGRPGLFKRQNSHPSPVQSPPLASSSWLPTERVSKYQVQLNNTSK